MKFKDGEHVKVIAVLNGAPPETIGKVGRIASSRRFHRDSRIGDPEMYRVEFEDVSWFYDSTELELIEEG